VADYVSNPSLVSIPAGWTLIHREETDSTNAECRALVNEGAAHGTVVWADRQTSGRGRQDRVWKSIQGNLTFSVILRPDCTLAESGKISFMSAVALCEALEKLAPNFPAQCKWPNDVLGAKGKLSGILLEGCGLKNGKPSAVIVGVGVNMSWRPEIDALYTASSLDYEGADLTRESVLGAYLERLHAWCDIWQAQGFGPLRAAWLQRAKGLGQSISVRLPNETLQGTFESLDADGGLVLSGLPEGTRIIRAGDVFFA